MHSWNSARTKPTIFALEHTHSFLVTIRSISNFIKINRHHVWHKAGVRVWLSYSLAGYFMWWTKEKEKKSHCNDYFTFLLFWCDGINSFFSAGTLCYFDSTETTQCVLLVFEPTKRMSSVRFSHQLKTKLTIVECNTEGSIDRRKRIWNGIPIFMGLKYKKSGCLKNGKIKGQ